MDDRLPFLMMALLIAFFALLAVTVAAAFRRRDRIGWNVVNAALTLRRMTPEQVAEVERAVSDSLPAAGVRPASWAKASPAVRFAFMSITMQRLGIAPADASHPWRPLRSPFLARSAAGSIIAARIVAESRHGVHLTELDEPLAAPGR